MHGLRGIAEPKSSSVSTLAASDNPLAGMGIAGFKSRASPQRCPTHAAVYNTLDMQRPLALASEGSCTEGSSRRLDDGRRIRAFHLRARQVNLTTLSERVFVTGCPRATIRSLRPRQAASAGWVFAEDRACRLASAWVSEHLLSGDQTERGLNFTDRPQLLRVVTATQ